MDFYDCLIQQREQKNSQGKLKIKVNNELIHYLYLMKQSLKIRLKKKEIKDNVIHRELINLLQIYQKIFALVLTV